jgi:hypothetical protein
MAEVAKQAAVLLIGGVVGTVVLAYLVGIVMLGLEALRASLTRNTDGAATCNQGSAPENGDG